MGHVEIKASKPYGRAALYARVSSEQQIQAQTIASQIEAIKERMIQDGFNCDPELFFVDDGYSGASLVRPALERLRDMAALGTLDRVYAHCPDRLARKYAYQVLLIDELKRCGVEVVFLNHAVGDSPEDQLLLQVQGMVAEYERAKIMERSRRGKLHAARRASVSPIGKAPYGYRYVTSQETHGQAVYQIDLEQARTVRQIFAWAGQDRIPLQEICRRLQKQGILTPTGRGQWGRTSIWQILKNPAYKGQAAYGRTRLGPRRPSLRPLRGAPEQPRRAVSVYRVPQEEWISIPVPSIVSADLFETVQDQLEENRKRFRRRRGGATYLLQGLAVCKCCGYAYYGKLSTRPGHLTQYGYYRCTGTDRSRFEADRVCQNRPVHIDRLDEAVWQEVCSLLQDPGRVAQEYERRLHRTSRSKSSDPLKALVQKVKRGISRLIDAYQDGLIDRTEFEPRLEQSRKRLHRLNEEMQAIQHAEQQEEGLRLVIGHIETFAKRVQENLGQADWRTKRDIIQTLVKRVEIDEKAVTVVYRVNDLPFALAPDRGLPQHCSKRRLTQMFAVPAKELVTLLFVSLLFFVVKMKPTSVEDAPHVPFSVRIYLSRAETRSRREGLAEGEVGCSPRREGGSRKDPKILIFESVDHPLDSVFHQHVGWASPTEWVFLSQRSQRDAEDFKLRLNEVGCSPRRARRHTKGVFFLFVKILLVFVVIMNPVSVEDAPRVLISANVHLAVLAPWRSSILPRAEAQRDSRGARFWVRKSSSQKTGILFV